MALQRQHIIRFAKADLDEAGDEFWTTTVVNDYADRANRAVYREIVKVNPGYFLATETLAWPSGQVSANISTTCKDSGGLTAAEPHLVLAIEETPNAGAISTSNLPRVMTAMRFRERPVKYTSHHQLISQSSKYSWEIQGDSLFIAKVPTEALNLHIHYVPQLKAFASDTDEVLGGFAEPYHDAVAACLAYLMNMKQEGENPEVTKAWYQWKADIQAMASVRRSDGPKHVTITRARNGGW